MQRPPKLPLPVGELPESVRRFGNPDAPAPAKMMAARGLVPIEGGGLVTLLVQLSADKDEAVRDAATKSFEGLPDTVLLPACEGDMHPSVIDEVALRCRTCENVLERLVQNTRTADTTIERIARTSSERLSELIAVNQQRLLGAPEIVEALYKNKNTRMSTADRLIELCARNGVELHGIPSFHEHVEAIKGQLIPEPTDEPLPGDQLFQQVLEESEDEEAIEIDRVDGTEEIKEKFKPLSFRIRQMSVSEKIRMAVIGDAAARSILVRDGNRLVSTAAINSPSMTAAEAAGIAHSKEIGEDVLRRISNRKEWTKSYEVKRALVFNPKTPIGLSMKFLGHLRQNDLKSLSRSRGVPGALKAAAKHKLTKKGNR